MRYLWLALSLCLTISVTLPEQAWAGSKRESKQSSAKKQVAKKNSAKQAKATQKKSGRTTTTARKKETVKTAAVSTKAATSPSTTANTQRNSKDDTGLSQLKTKLSGTTPKPSAPPVIAPRAPVAVATPPAIASAPPSLEHTKKLPKNALVEQIVNLTPEEIERAREVSRLEIQQSNRPDTEKFSLIKDSNEFYATLKGMDPLQRREYVTSFKK